MNASPKETRTATWIFAVLGAVAALAGLAVWDWQGYIFIRMCLTAFSWTLGILAFSSAKSDGRAAFLFFAAGGIGWFWCLTQGVFSREANMVFNVLTAIALIVLAATAPRQRVWPVAAYAALAIGCVVMIGAGTSGRLGATESLNECFENREYSGLSSAECSDLYG